MNQHYAEVTHGDRMAKLRGEADASRLAAQSRRDQPLRYPRPLAHIHRMTAAVAALLGYMLRRA